MNKTKCLVLVLLAGALIPTSCVKKKEPPLPAVEEKEAQQALEEVYLQETEGGKKRWELWAETVDLFPGRKVFKKVRFKFYGEDKILYLKGDEAEVQNDSGDMQVLGHVTGKTEEGVEFTADALTWQAKPGRLITESPVKLMAENIYITGTGMESTPHLKEARIIKDVRVTFFQRINDEAPMVITSETLFARFGDKPEVRFEGEAKVDDNRVKVTSDKLTIFFSQAGRRAVESIAEGKVNILAKDIEAECGYARLLNEEKVIILQDNPILWHEKVKCRGRKITYWLEEGRLVIEDNIQGVFLPK
jgi:LPS export ABC transporter protein LptC